MSLYQPQKRKKKQVILILLLILTAIIGFIYSQKKASSSITANITAEKPIVIAYQTGIDPSKLGQVANAYEKAIGKKIIWKKFDSGADILVAMAAGDVDIANIGSAPFSVAVSQGLPIEAFYISAILGSSEALVVRDNPNTIKTHLVGKKIAVPFTSTTHYSLLAALSHLNIDEKSVQLINLRPSEIVAAWERGDIDGAYVWEPALGQLKASGQVIISGRDVKKWGNPTYDLWVVDRNFATQNPNILAQFVFVTNNEVQWYNQNKDNLLQNTEITQQIAQLTGSKRQDVETMMKSNDYPNLQEQADILTTYLANDIRNTSLFLHQQGSIDFVKDSYIEDINVLAVNQVIGR